MISEAPDSWMFFSFFIFWFMLSCLWCEIRLEASAFENSSLAGLLEVSGETKSSLRQAFESFYGCYLQSLKVKRQGRTKTEGEKYCRYESSSQGDVKLRCSNTLPDCSDFHMKIYFGYIKFFAKSRDSPGKLLSRWWFREPICLYLVIPVA